MKLRKKQREYLLQLVAEGLRIGEINERAAQFKPRFKVTPQQVDYYRKTRAVSLDEIQADSEVQALKAGLSQKDERVALLQKLADCMIEDLLVKRLLWTENAKSIGLERYDYLEFNRAEIDALRGVLDDIAKEVGGRRPETQNNNTFNFFNLEEWKKTRDTRLQEVERLESD